MQRRAAKILSFVALAAMIVLIGRSILFPPPPIPIRYADGTYANGSCGMITLSGGVMTWGKNEEHYTLGDDKVGVYALTDHQLENSAPQSGCRLRTDPNLKIRFEPRDHPTTMDVMSEKPGSYRFTRISTQ